MRDGKKPPKDPHVRRIAPRPDYRLYEALKSRLPLDLTPAEYEHRVREIAKLCGL